MPARDIYHSVVKQALIKANWIITHDPFPLRSPKVASFQSTNGGNYQMATIDKYRQIVKQLLNEYAEIPTAESGIKNHIIFDSENDRYMLIALGWSQEKRIHYCIIHIDIIEEQVWIQANNTDYLIAEELVTAGIPTISIVLGMQPPEVRPYTTYWSRKK